MGLKIEDFQKKWLNGDRYLSCCRRHNWSGHWGYHQRFEKLGKGLANDLKTVGEKAASALPGLIGAIASFLFKAAASVLGFLAEHAWLLILAVVAFLFQKLMKKR